MNKIREKKEKGLINLIAVKIYPEELFKIRLIKVIYLEFFNLF